MKTQRLTTLVTLLAAVIFFSACEKLDSGLGITGQGPMLKEKLYHDNFKNIEVDVDAKVYLTQSYFQAVVIKGQGNILSNLAVVVEHETLKINYLEKVHTHEKLEIYITLPVLNNLSTARGAHIKSERAFGSNHLNLQVYGAGKINMEIAHANIIQSRITGSGQISLNGQCGKLDVVINGSGSVLSAGLFAQQSKVSITGTGKCEINSQEELSVIINGNGKVYYAGNPATLHSSLSGNGELRILD